MILGGSGTPGTPLGPPLLFVMYHNLILDIDNVELSEIPMLSTIKWNITAYGDDDQMDLNWIMKCHLRTLI